MKCRCSRWPSEILAPAARADFLGMLLGAIFLCAPPAATASENPASGLLAAARAGNSEAVKAMIEKGAPIAAKGASSEEGFKLAASELEEAIRLAPWWNKPYYNLGLVREKLKDYEAAIRNLELYLLAAPRAVDAEAVRHKIYELEGARKLREKAGL